MSQTLAIVNVKSGEFYEGKRHIVYYLPVAERILCLSSGFSRNTDSARFNI